MTTRTSPGPAKFAAAKAFNVAGLAAFTIGVKTANVINVAVQLQDARAQSVAQICTVYAWLASVAAGTTLSTTAPTSNTAIGTNGTLLVAPTTGFVFDILSNATGQFDLNLTQTASPVTYYLAIEMPDGSVVVSPAITF